jgi:pimeloyl-ACP methyl ester carboxylesterase
MADPANRGTERNEHLRGRGGGTVYRAPRHETSRQSGIDFFGSTADVENGSAAANRSQFYRDLASGPFFGFNRPSAKVSQGSVDWFWMQGILAGHKNTYDCIKAFSETDFTEDRKQFDFPTLIVHGDDDQIVPIGAAGRASAKLARDSVLKVYAGAPHGLTDTHKEQLNANLLAFCQSAETRKQAR